MQKKLKIYLCDLTHDTIIFVSDTIPINIGFIGAFVKKHYDREVELSLFKYPRTVIAAIEASPPDVLALSNYSWNSQLSEHIAGFAKQRHPRVITVQGGTNFPHEEELQRDFLLARPNTDIFVEGEAEVTFAGLIGRMLSARDGGPGLFDAPIPGCVYLQPSTRASREPMFVKGVLPDRLKQLDDIPSPYVSGILDPFFDGSLSPFLETNRGCPFQCTFCHTGNDYYNKINMFSLERVIEEIEFLAPRAASLGISTLLFADTNFGMYPRDAKISEELYKVCKSHGWPRQVMATTGKNNKQRVIEVTKIMGNMFAVNMSVQSMDAGVLANIKRDNIRLEDYAAVNRHLNASGRGTKGELIVGLPGETKDSFVRGVEEIIDAGVSLVCMYSLMLLHGTPFKNPDYRRQFEIQGKFRLVPLNFGEYAGTRVFDIEETGITTKDMSFEDYLWLRKLCLVVEVIYNNRPFLSLFRQASVMGFKASAFILRVYRSIEQAPKRVQDVVNGFMEETRGELWDSEEELVAHYRRDEHYKKLLAGEVGGNLVYKYKAMSLAFCSHEWIAYLGAILQTMAEETVTDNAQQQAVRREIETIVEFEQHRLHGLLDATADLSPRTMRSDYDIFAWLRSSESVPLSHYTLTPPVQYVFEYTKEQLADRQHYFGRYGTHVNALSKIVTRVGNVESLYRTVRTHSDQDGELAGDTSDTLVRYMLSH